MGLGAQLVHWPTGFVQALVDKGYYVIRFDNRSVGLVGLCTSVALQLFVTSTLLALASWLLKF